MKKKKPSNNTKKLLGLTLIINACIESLGSNHSHGTLQAVTNNIMSLATKMHPQDDLDTIYSIVKEYVKSDESKEKIEAESTLAMALLCLDQNKLLGFFGLSNSSVPNTELQTRDIRIFLAFLDHLDEQFNTSPFVDTYLPPKKEKPKKVKRVRDKSKKEVKATPKKKVKMVTETNVSALLSKLMPDNGSFKMEDGAINLLLERTDIDLNVPFYDYTELNVIAFSREIKATFAEMEAYTVEV